MKTKIFVISIVIALLFASLPATSVLAAPVRDGGTTEDDNSLELEWSNKTRLAHYESLFYNRIRLFPADFEDPDDLAAAYEIVHKYGFALDQANEIILNHTGFDKKGRVVNEIQADQSVKDLAMYLHIMCGLREKLDEGDYEITLLK